MIFLPSRFYHCHFYLDNYTPVLPQRQARNFSPDRYRRHFRVDTSAVRIYYKMIKYESGLNLQEREGQVWCGDSLVERYTFRTNWYFMGGDNMWNSQDSRYLGPIPEEFIIGKATLILTAKDPETKAYRWRRFFTRIRKEVKNR